MLRLRAYLISLASALTGGLALFLLRVARRTESGKQLDKCDKVGTNVTVGRDFSVDNTGLVRIGNDVSILSRCLISSYKEGSVTIGSNCFIGDNCKIVSDKANVVIGDDCLIAEDVVIRAGNHGTRAGMLMRLQNNVVADIRIGRDVWIGRGVTVLAGASVADGCVIGANSVVRGQTEMNTVYAGVPIRKIKARSND
jgi:carbonic anhydrase/acetyltransferase-like protein (isoleucine patch superfamily)